VKTGLVSDNVPRFVPVLDEELLVTTVPVRAIPPTVPENVG
jgi:hypothetical protein